MRTALLVVVALLLPAMAYASSPQVSDPYRDVHAGFEILIPYGWDFGLLNPTSVVISSPRALKHWVSVGFGVHAVGPFFVSVVAEFAHERFRERCTNDPSDPRPVVERVYVETRIAGQAAHSCSEYSTEFDEYYGPEALDRRVIVRNPSGGAVSFRLLSCSTDRCEATRDLFEAMLASLTWLGP